MTFGKESEKCRKTNTFLLLDECFIEFLNEEKADGCIRDIRKRFGEGMIKNAVLLTGLAVPKSKAVVSLPGNMLNK